MVQPAAFITNIAESDFWRPQRARSPVAPAARLRRPDAARHAAM